MKSVFSVCAKCSAHTFENPILVHFTLLNFHERNCILFSANLIRNLYLITAVIFAFRGILTSFFKLFSFYCLVISSVRFDVAKVTISPA